MDSIPWSPRMTECRQFPQAPSPPLVEAGSRKRYSYLALAFQRKSKSSNVVSSAISTSNHHRNKRMAPLKCPPLHKGNADADEGFDDKNNNNKEWIHFVGIGGCGLSALAMLALHQGFRVSGSDIVWSNFMDGLHQAGAVLYLGHSSSNIQRNNGTALPTALVVSSAIPPDNEEILHAQSLGVPVYKRGDWLGKITEQFDVIAISGTHGKSTIASMVAFVLDAMGYNPTAVVGAHVPQFPRGNIISGCGNLFVLEADEYDGCFLGLSPYVVVVSNVEWEHVDIFQDEEQVRNMFRRLLQKIRPGGHLILCGNSAGAYALLDHSKKEMLSEHGLSIPSVQLSNINYRITTYGTSETNEWWASSILPNSEGGTDYMLYHRGSPVASISLKLPGVHNVLNSLAVIATVMSLLDDKMMVCEAINSVRLHLTKFVGVSRRFESIGKIHGCHIYDDYAHHPTEIRAVIQAARQKFPCHALWVIFQPHTFSRLASLMKDFATAFSGADCVIVTEVYAARERNVWKVDGRDLATCIAGPFSEYIPKQEDLVETLVLKISSLYREKGVVVLTLGAGDITTLGPKLLSELENRSEQLNT